MDSSPVLSRPRRLFNGLVAFGWGAVRLTWALVVLTGRGLWWLRVNYPFWAGFALCATLFLGTGVTQWSKSLLSDWYTQLSAVISSLGRLAGDGHTFNGCDAECQTVIKTRRATIVGIEENEVRYVQAELRREYASSTLWNTTRVQTCVANWGMYVKAQQYTLYPAALLAGKAYVEGAGCTFAHSGDGGYGPMQITTPEAWHENAVGAMLHEPRSWVKDAWHGKLTGESGPSWSYWTNVLVGAVMLSGYEEQFNSRGVGIFAYNSGPGAAKKYMREGNLAGYGDHQISDFRGALPESFRDGSRPRIYVDRILAGAVMVDRAHRGLQVTDGSWIDQLTLADIPGADPRKDSMP